MSFNVDILIHYHSVSHGSRNTQNQPDGLVSLIKKKFFPEIALLFQKLKGHFIGSTKTENELMFYSNVDTNFYAIEKINRDK